MKTLTLTDFRREPGERIREVTRAGVSFLLTKSGRPIARLVPVSETTIIQRDGSIYGEQPLTKHLQLGKEY